MTIQTPPNAAADSYTDIATADAYHATRLNVAAWSSASTADKESALKMATRQLERERWTGEKTDDLVDNSLRWPRSYVLNSDDQYEDETTVPQAIQEATAELALDLLKAAADETAGDQFATSEVQVGPIKLKLDTDTQLQSASDGLSSEVDTLIAPYVEDGSSIDLVRA